MERVGHHRRQDMVSGCAIGGRTTTNEIPEWYCAIDANAFPLLGSVH